MNICKYCNTEINKDDKWIRDSGIYHFDCYIDKKMLLKRHKSKEFYINKANEMYNKRIESEFRNKTKDDFYKYIQDVYEITLIPTYTFIKMDSIFKGTYKGLNKPIDVQDIFDMFVKKKNVLDKIYSSNIAKGMNFDSIGRFNYDLAILLSQYDKYINWKEKIKVNKITEVKTDDIIKHTSINNIINNTIKREKITQDDIEDIVDEI